MCENCGIYDREPNQEAMESAVQAGIAWLDEHGPEDWRSLVNVRILDINSTQYCVLGQVFAKYANNPEHTRTGYWGDPEMYYSGYDYAVHTFLNGQFHDSITGPLGFSGYCEEYSNEDLDAVWRAALSA